jgi:PBP1b-binding outer membrane lipoprotein LpoB
MKMKSQFAIASLLFAGILASGCSQQQAAGEQTTSAQQTAAAPAAPVAPVAPVAPIAPVVPKVKAKGNYKGPVAQDAASAAAMQQYKKHKK